MKWDDIPINQKEALITLGYTRATFYGFCDPKGSPARSTVQILATNDGEENFIDLTETNDYNSTFECDEENQ